MRRSKYNLSDLQIHTIVISRKVSVKLQKKLGILILSLISQTENNYCFLCGLLSKKPHKTLYNLNLETFLYYRYNVPIKYKLTLIKLSVFKNTSLSLLSPMGLYFALNLSNL